MGNLFEEGMMKLHAGIEDPDEIQDRLIAERDAALAQVAELEAQLQQPAPLTEETVRAVLEQMRSVMRTFGVDSLRVLWNGRWVVRPGTFPMMEDDFARCILVTPNQEGSTNAD